MSQCKHLAEYHKCRGRLEDQRAGILELRDKIEDMKDERGILKASNAMAFETMAKDAAHNAQLVEALTKIQTICQKPDLDDSYSYRDMGIDWREILGIARTALANTEKETP